MNSFLVIADLTIRIRSVFVRKGNIYSGKLEFILALGYIVLTEEDMSSKYFSSQAFDLMVKKKNFDVCTDGTACYRGIQVSTTTKSTYLPLQLTTCVPPPSFFIFFFFSLNIHRAICLHKYFKLEKNK